MTAGRAHLRSDGRPKAAFATLGEASRAAMAQTVPGRVLLVAYRCTHCPAFHVGRPSLVPATVDDASWVELGDRVIWHLRRENAGPVPRLLRKRPR